MRNSRCHIGKGDKREARKSEGEQQKVKRHKRLKGNQIVRETSTKNPKSVENMGRRDKDYDRPCNSNDNTCCRTETREGPRVCPWGLWFWRGKCSHPSDECQCRLFAILKSTKQQQQVFFLVDEGLPEAFCPKVFHVHLLQLSRISLA